MDNFVNVVYSLSHFEVDFDAMALLGFAIETYVYLNSKTAEGENQRTVILNSLLIVLVTDHGIFWIR